MRTKKASINAIVALSTYIISFLPSLIVRKVFLQTLGEELLGLSSLYLEIIGVLSIIELGIGNAIIYSLYKPFAEGNKTKIKGYLNYYSKFYKIVGLVILFIGISILPFIDLVINTSIDIIDVRLYFVLYLINTFISYIFSYKTCILYVAQENYIVSIATTISKLAIAIVQLLFMKIYPSFYVYILVQIIINLIYYVVLNSYIDKKFFWIKSTKGNISKKEKKCLIKNINALFMHKIGGKVVFGIDNIVISKFVNLSIVGKFATYNMLIGAFQGVIGTVTNAITSSIGNLIAEGNKEKIYDIHKKMFFMNFWIVSFIIISLSNTLEQFISIFFGKEQILDKLTLALILANSYFFLMRSSVERFKDAAGEYSRDKYIPIVESLVNLIFSVAFVKIIGLPGVILGTLISNIFIVFWIKPKIVYEYVFEKSLLNYFIMYFKYLFIASIPLILTNIITMNFRATTSIIDFIINCILNILIINIFYFLVFKENKEFAYFKNLIYTLFKGNKK